MDATDTAARAALLYRDYLQLPEDDHQKYEMLWGALHVAASPRFKHQLVQMRLGAMLHQYVDSRDLGVIVGPVDLYRDELNYVQPDLSYFTAEQASLVADQQTIREVPLLVVEILSPSTAGKDKQDKLRWYAELGVREYWIVDSDARSVEVHDPLTGASAEDDPVRSTLFPDLLLDRRAIFG